MAKWYNVYNKTTDGIHVTYATSEPTDGDVFQLSDKFQEFLNNKHKPTGEMSFPFVTSDYPKELFS